MVCKILCQKAFDSGPWCLLAPGDNVCTIEPWMVSKSPADVFVSSELKAVDETST